jgi:hypothetical protein
MPLLGCGACGVRAIGIDCVQVPLEDLDCLRLSRSETQDHKRLGRYGVVASVFVAFNGTHFHLHPELVSTSSNGLVTVSLCKDCHSATSKGKVPHLSVASGVDFGVLSRLPADLSIPSLSLVEMQLVAPVRLYAAIVKLTPAGPSSSILIGHVITFRHDGPEVAAKAFNVLPNADALASVQVAFVGTQQQWENHKAGALACGSLRARPWVVRRFLEVKKAIDPQYAALDILSENEIEILLKDATQKFIDDVMLIDNEKSIRMDKVVHTDVAGVRKFEEDEDFSHLPAKREDVCIVSHALLSRNEGDDSSNHLLQSIQRTVIGNHASEPSTPVKEPAAPQSDAPPKRLIVSRLDNVPLNEFVENHNLYHSAFPHLFPLGKGITTTGSIPQKGMIHMLNQVSRVFAKDPPSINASAINMPVRWEHFP